MKPRLEPRRRSAYVVAALVSLITIAIVALPEQAFQASLDGLRVWWDIVFPALLPFFIASDTLMGLGAVHFIGALLEPLMRPLFGVPGVGAFALAMGLASGYPIGARITARLRREGLCSRVEAERLVSFTNTADPLFMVGAVAVGMFRIPSLGPILAASHYVSAILVGLLLKSYGRRERERRIEEYRREESMLSRAAHELYTARSQDNRSFGQIFGDAVKDSVGTLLLIGGCIMIFSVVIRVLTVFRVTQLISAPLTAILAPFGVPRDLVASLVGGFFEITIGTEMASRAAATIAQRTVAASAIIAWSGLSVFAQVASMLFGTDVRLTPYFFARIGHALLAAVAALVILNVAPWTAQQTASVPSVAITPGFWTVIRYSCTTLGKVLAIGASATAALAFLAKPRVFSFKVNK
ncbi:MAG: sporulation integral membrane protein YlbJ [Firmicutes bacterium]|nr:sporulation integral membrane protein YlbJ [Bacillota bacterium]MDD4336251.1 sporulation integral membrane protein YlbJ [Bacillota bacterium]MDD4791662.1 sporulation integral membrane protein YlbJ [Bacillota bacterium]